MFIHQILISFKSTADHIMSSLHLYYKRRTGVENLETIFRRGFVIKWNTEEKKKTFSPNKDTRLRERKQGERERGREREKETKYMST